MKLKQKKGEQKVWCIHDCFLSFNALFVQHLNELQKALQGKKGKINVPSTAK